MTDHDRLFAAALSAPDDDTTRLVYADFLEEQGGPVHGIRAKLIRAACELDRGPADDRLARRYDQYEARVRRWAADTYPTLLPHPSEHRRGLAFDRGLPVLAVETGVRSRLPVETLPPGFAADVRLYGSPHGPDELVWFAQSAAGWAFADRVVGLTAGGPGAAAASHLTHLPTPFPRLTRFDLFAPPLLDADVGAAAWLPPPPQLRELTVSASPTLTRGGLVDLVRGSFCGGLRRLSVNVRGDPAEQFYRWADRFGAVAVPGEPAAWGGYDVPRPGRPPLRLVFGESLLV